VAGKNVWSEDPALEGSEVTGTITVTQEVVTVSNNGQTVVPFTLFTVVDVASLAVILNGVRQIEGVTEAYILSSENSVTFTEGLTLNDDVLFIHNAADATPASIVAGTSVSLTAAGIPTNAQSVIAADTALSITELRNVSGTSHGAVAMVSDNGTMNQYYWDLASSVIDDGISVIHPTSITGAGRWLLSLGNFVDTIHSVYSSGAVGALARVIFLGDVTIGDGSGGIFYWDPATSKATATGVNIVDTSVSFANQGTGAGTGCYIRVSTF